MLCSLSQVIWSKSCFILNQSRADILEFSSLVIDITCELGVFFFKLLILISLFGIEIIKTSFILEVDIWDLGLIALNYRLHIFLFREQFIQMFSLFVILVFDVVVKCCNVICLCVTSIFVKSQVVISKITLGLPNFNDKWFILAL